MMDIIPEGTLASDMRYSQKTAVSQCHIHGGLCNIHKTAEFCVSGLPLESDRRELDQQTQFTWLMGIITRSIGHHFYL